MSYSKALGRIIRGPYQNWGIETGMRYLPVVKLIKQAGLEDKVTELGSGTFGITPYLHKKVTGIDTNFFEGETPLLKQLKASVLDIPCKNRSLDCVISVDMLEHVPPKLRPKAVDEMVRVSNKLMVLACPEGKLAEAQDKQLAAYWKRWRSEDYLFFREHIENGLPKRGEMDVWVRDALRKYRRSATVEFQDNSNLVVREWLTKIWIRSTVPDKVFWILLNYLHPIFTRLNFGNCYRQIAVVKFED